MTGSPSAPGNQPAASSYRDALYGSYVSGHQGEIAEPSSQSSLAAQILPHLPADRAASILDVGCGQGQLVRLITGLGYVDVSGIDLSEEQIALARRLGSGRVETGDLFELAATSPGAYDAVIAVDVVEHFDRPDVQRVFQAFADLLKPGGTFILRTPNGSSPYAGRYLFSDLTHGVIYTDQSIEQVGFVTGFASMQSYPAPPVGRSMKARIRQLLWHAVSAAFKIPLIIETGQVRGHIVTQNLIAVGTKAS